MPHPRRAESPYASANHGPSRRPAPSSSCPRSSVPRAERAPSTNRSGPNAPPTNSGRTAVMATKLIGLNNGVGGRVIAPEQDDAAHRDEDQQEHESEKVKDQSERRNDTTEAKALKEEQHSGEDGHPPE